MKTLQINEAVNLVVDRFCKDRVCLYTSDIDENILRIACGVFAEYDVESFASHDNMVVVCDLSHECVNRIFNIQ